MFTHAQYSPAPVALFMLLAPLFLHLVRKLMFANVSLHVYFTALGGISTSVVGPLCIILWTVWWGSKLKVDVQVFVAVVHHLVDRLVGI